MINTILALTITGALTYVVYKFNKTQKVRTVRKISHVEKRGMVFVKAHYRKIANSKPLEIETFRKPILIKEGETVIGEINL